MKDKIKVAILFGGRSAEHEVSLLSAQNVYRTLNREKYEPVLIGIDKLGKWYYQEESLKLFHANDPKKIALADKSTEILFSQNTDEKFIQPIQAGKERKEIDVIFPMLHGPFGEDGSIQGLAKLANIPCVGAGIAGSSMGMDKEIMKRLLRDAGIASADFITIKRKNRLDFDYNTVSDKLGKVVFVKPANLGSSVGISKVSNQREFKKAIEIAFQYDNKILVEEKITGREIECAVLGNENPRASIPGEIIPRDGFYSYEYKYVDESGATLEIPANLTEDEIIRVQNLSIKTFEVLECQGMARVDMFLKNDGSLLINEINTIPGFTNISMYPALWEYSGIPNDELIDRLIQLAIEAHDQMNRLKIDV